MTCKSDTVAVEHTTLQSGDIRLEVLCLEAQGFRCLGLAISVADSEGGERRG